MAPWVLVPVLYKKKNKPDTFFVIRPAPLTQYRCCFPPTLSHALCSLWGNMADSGAMEMHGLVQEPSGKESPGSGL